MTAKHKLSYERKKSLRKLAGLMNTQNVHSIPVTGHLLKCFDIAISQKETDFLLKVSTKPRTYKQLLKFSGLNEDEFSLFIKKILKKGLISSQVIKNKKEAFMLSPILVGWFEVYLSDGEESDEKKEFAESFEKYFSSRGILNFFPVRNYLNHKFKRSPKPITRVIASAKKPRSKIEINRKIEVEPVNIYPSKNVSELIEKFGEENKIAVIHCFCRQWKKMIGKPCGFKISGESCVVIGEGAEHVVKHGIGRYISKQKAFKIISETYKKGAVHQVFHKKENLSLPEIAICNCCWDCCGVLSAYNRGLSPLCVKSYYYAEIADNSQCTGCGNCTKHCPVNAVSFKGNKIVVDKEICIGCGQCEAKCSKNIFNMVNKERDVILPMLKKSKVRIR